MKIAVVGPSPVPFAIGGAENLMWGLCEAMNQITPHQAELIKLPSRESDFWSLLHSYYDFYRLRLEQFDFVIATKYPSWMIRHPNCICYMIHTLRGLYDTYHCFGLSKEVERANPYVNKVLDFMEERRQMDDLEDFFHLLFSLEEQRNIPDPYLKFPGPLIRKIVHYLDHMALSQEGMKHIYAISKTVKYRKEYYPPNCRIDVVYPPTVLKKRNKGNQQHIFVASRLDGAKRIDMLIRAMKYVKSDIPLYIAGTGPKQEEWEALAKKDQRIHFLGFVDADTLEKYYADSLVIPYFPLDEDYGLITIEAMLHQKPVITTADAGGPTEFVAEGETGFITRFEEKALAEKIDFLTEHPLEAERMGKNAFEKVKEITWENAVEKLLNGSYADSTDLKECENSKRARITVTSTFPIYPPQGGGQARIYHLYKNIAKDYDVDIVSFTGADQKSYEGFIAKGLKEIRIPKSGKHQELEWKMEKKAKLPITDIAMITLSGYTPEYGKRLRESVEKSDMVIISHPYLYYEARNYLCGRSFVYEAHNIEFAMKKCMLPDSSIKEELLQRVYDIEKECCDKSEFIVTCSAEDQLALHKCYGTPLDKMVLVPNGADCEQVCFTAVEQRMKNKQRLGLEQNTIGVFMGSWHQPNLEACERIFEIAVQCPEIQFLLMGSQCDFFKGKKLPENVGLLGVVSEEAKAKIFETVDFALNPMMSGSGTNLKMFDYMAAGIPVITTEFGARGIEDKKGMIVAAVEDMPGHILEFSLAKMQEKVEYAWRSVKEQYDWKKISSVFLERLENENKGIKYK